MQCDASQPKPFGAIGFAGVSMRFNDSDRSIQVDMHQTLQFVYAVNVAAFYNSQLSGGDSEERVEKLRAAVATASSAKAAEVQKLLVELQKVQIT